MRKVFFSLILVLGLLTSCAAQNENLLLDDFEGALSGGLEGSVDFGAGEGSSVEVTADTSIKYSGSQSLKITFEAVPGGYMWIARGFDLDAQNTQWLIKPAEIKWNEYTAFSFYMYGSDSKAKIAFDIKDNGNEMWRFMVEDNFKGWKQITCPFNAFFCRDDWQPGNADSNANLDFPIKSFQFEPHPEAKGMLCFDKVELIK